ncbi:MAG: S41 family peptidase [Planctomycetota bacterium]
MVRRCMLLIATTAALAHAAVAVAAGRVGYYRHPALHSDRIVFTAEGDLWMVGTGGGEANRLTTHHGDETHAAISPDGTTVAFCASYEGPVEVYTMPVDGGVPVRRTYGGERVAVVGWTPDGASIIAATRHLSTVPDTQLVLIDVADGTLRRVPLHQAADGAYAAPGGPLLFTRLPFQGSHTKRYKGGTAQSIWRFDPGADEAVPLTADFAGTSRRPMVHRGRVYHVSDRDGTMNIFSMRSDGSDLRQHTRHVGFDVSRPSLHDGRIAYQLGADLWLLDLADDRTQRLDVTLRSDFDQMRERWIDEPMEYLTAVRVAPGGERVALTARGEVFVFPKDERLRRVRVTRAPGVRYRSARFMPDGKSLLAISDETGELEFWRLPADGVGTPEPLTGDGDVLRRDGVPSPDGRWIAYADKNFRLWVHSIEEGTRRMVVESPWEEPSDLAWSPDSRWLAFADVGANTFARVMVYDVTDGSLRPVTTDRFHSASPAWSADGRWLYFLSERDLVSVVPSPWGRHQPDPYLDRKARIYMVSLTAEPRSPFLPHDELTADAAAEEKADEDEDDAGGSGDGDGARDGGEEEGEEVPSVEIVFDGIVERVMVAPVPRGDYSDLQAGRDALYWRSSVRTPERKSSLQAIAVGREKPEVKTVMDDVTGFEIDATPFAPREAWRQMFVDSWRLERDYFYDPGTHGVDWDAMRDKYLPLVDRVTTRGELSDLIAQMVGELAALHIFVRGGDLREGPDEIPQGTLGARLGRDEGAGGYRVDHVYRSDPDLPDLRSPLARPEADVRAGDVITAVDGVATLSVDHVGRLLRDTAGRQVLLHVRSPGESEARSVIVTPITVAAERNLRYEQWELERREMVEAAGDGKIGYVHLRAMGGRNYGEWARHFYPVFDRQGLIVDVRHNRGGNIDSWILSKLLRPSWMYWQGRVGAPTWNMQYAFRGHVVVLCNEWTASDGEAFAEGFRRLGLGPVIGTRTWGGEIWLTSSNLMVDKGIASAAEFGVYGPEGVWLIEGHGVEPDVVVDNLPHATFNGADAQLQAAIDYLLRRIAEEPRPVPPPPAHPDLSAP